MNLKWVIFILVLILISGCSQGEQFNQSAGEIELIDQDLIEKNLVDPELVNREWVLDELDKEPLINGTNIILAFDDSSFSGFAGCNGYGGPVELAEGGGIKFGEMSSQAEGCIEPEGVLDQEVNYLNQLLAVKQYRVDGNELTLTIPESGKTLIYTLRAPFDMDPEALGNTDWQLSSSDNFPLIGGSQITLSFANGKIHGFGGCRDYQGEYEAKGDEIRFPMMEMLDDVCDDEDLLIQEGKFTTALELSIHYQVQDDQLTLFLATGETVIFERVE